VFASNELTLASFDCVYALNEEVVTNVPALPETSGILTANVVASPFVNVRLRVPLLNDAVIKKLPLSLSVIQLPLCAPMLVHFWSLLPV